VFLCESSSEFSCGEGVCTFSSLESVGIFRIFAKDVS
jgi:hypothetical protein